MNNGGLKKMLIEAYTEPDLSGSPVDTFEVMFNPDSYTRKYDVEYEEPQGQGDTATNLTFGKIKPQEFSFEFLFDGTGTATDRVEVKDVVETFLTICGKQDGEIHRPRYLKLSWGALLVGCVLKSAEITYTLFKPDGDPLRAKVKTLFAETVEAQLRVAEERKSSPDLTHIRIVAESDHLPFLTDRMYGNPAHYLQVAAVNRLKNFRRLTVGRELAFPPLRDSPDKA